MSDEHPAAPVARRVRALAELFVETDLLRLRIERAGEAIELGRRALHPDLVPDIPHDLGAIDTHPVRADQIRADLVGIFHLSRPAPAEGDLLESDRELAFIEALGIRNPVRSSGPGRILTVKRSDGEPVEYGAVLFEIDRG
jgi:biotin carboxyl carrier protein